MKTISTRYIIQNRDNKAKSNSSSKRIKVSEQMNPHKQTLVVSIHARMVSISLIISGPLVRSVAKGVAVFFWKPRASRVAWRLKFSRSVRLSNSPSLVAKNLNYQDKLSEEGN